METHSSVLAWRIPGMVEPGGLPSKGSHRVRHNWRDSAAAAATSVIYTFSKFCSNFDLIIGCQGTFDFKESNMLPFLKDSVPYQFLFWEWVKQHAVPGTEVIGWDMYESPSVTLFSISDLVCIRLSILWLLIKFHPV